jgi:hypothetical protein
MTTKVSTAEIAARACTEAEFQRTVIQVAEARGWRVYHTHDSRRSQAGFPDLVMVRSPRIVFAELKAYQKGHGWNKLSQEQFEWLSDLALCDLDCYVWDARDWERIHAVLA